MLHVERGLSSGDTHLIPCVTSVSEGMFTVTYVAADRMNSLSTICGKWIHSFIRWVMWKIWPSSAREAVAAWSPENNRTSKNVVGRGLHSFYMGSLCRYDVLLYRYSFRLERLMQWFGFSVNQSSLFHPNNAVLQSHQQTMSFILFSSYNPLALHWQPCGSYQSHWGGSNGRQRDRVSRETNDTVVERGENSRWMKEEETEGEEGKNGDPEQRTVVYGGSWYWWGPGSTNPPESLTNTSG